MQIYVLFNCTDCSVGQQGRKENQGKYEITTTTNSAAAAAQNYPQSAVVIFLTMQFVCYNFILRQQIQSCVPFRAGESLLSWVAQNMHHITL